MTEYLDKVVSVLIEQGVMGVICLALCYVIYKLWTNNNSLHTDKDELHKTMYAEAENDNKEKLEYLNQHIVAITKAGEAMSSTKESVDKLTLKIEALEKDFSEIKGKITGNG